MYIAGVAAHWDCGHDLKFTILPDEFPHDSMQVDFYKYKDVCAMTKYLHAHITRGLHLSQEAQFAECIPSYNLNVYVYMYFNDLRIWLTFTFKKMFTL